MIVKFAAEELVTLPLPVMFATVCALPPKSRIPELVIVVVDGKAFATPSRIVPPLIVVVPVYEFVEFNVSVPDPDLVSVPPLNAAESVVGPEVFKLKLKLFEVNALPRLMATVPVVVSATLSLKVSGPLNIILPPDKLMGPFTLNVVELVVLKLELDATFNGPEMKSYKIPVVMLPLSVLRLVSLIVLVLLSPTVTVFAVKASPLLPDKLPPAAAVVAIILPMLGVAAL